MKTLSLTLIAVVFFVGSVAAQQNSTTDDVPEAVISTFESMFPQVKSPEWEQDDDGWEAEFKLKGKEAEALFDDEGNWIETEEEIAKSKLPDGALKLLNGKMSDWKVMEASKVTTSNGIHYVAELDMDDSILELTFDNDGHVTGESIEEKDE